MRPAATGATSCPRRHSGVPAGARPLGPVSRHLGTEHLVRVSPRRGAPDADPYLAGFRSGDHRTLPGRSRDFGLGVAQPDVRVIMLDHRRGSTWVPSQR